MHKYSVLIAAFVMYVLRFAIFIEAPKSSCTGCSNIGGFPGLMILISTCIILTDVQLYPLRYKLAYVKTFFIIETIISLFVLEFVMILIWTRIEQNIAKFIKYMLSRGNLYQEMGGDSFLGLLMTGLTLRILLYSINATRSNDTIVNTLHMLKDDIHKIIEAIRSFIPALKYAPLQTAATTTFQFQCAPHPIIRPIQTRDPHCPIHGDSEIVHRKKI